MFKELRQTCQLCNFSGSHTMASELHSSFVGWACPFPIEASGSSNEWKWWLALCAAIFSPHYIMVADQTLTSQSAPALTLKWTEIAVSCHHNHIFSKCEAGHGCCSIRGPSWVLNIPWLLQECVWGLCCFCFTTPAVVCIVGMCNFCNYPSSCLHFSSHFG